MKSNQLKAREAVLRLDQWIKSAPTMPLHNGRLNVSRVCELVGVPLSTVRSNPAFRALLSTIQRQKPAVAASTEAAVPSMLEIRLRVLETENADLVRKVLLYENLLGFK